MSCKSSIAAIVNPTTGGTLAESPTDYSNAGFERITHLV
jgi:hypothetical protein